MSLKFLLPALLSLLLVQDATAQVNPPPTIICGICYFYNSVGERTQRKACCWDPNAPNTDPSGPPSATYAAIGNDGLQEESLSGDSTYTSTTESSDSTDYGYTGTSDSSGYTVDSAGYNVDSSFARLGGMSLTETGDPFSCSLFPNPTKGAFSILFNREIKSIELLILDARGRTIGSKKGENSRMIEYDITGVAAGNYMVMLIADNHKKTIQLIKQE